MTTLSSQSFNNNAPAPTTECFPIFNLSFIITQIQISENCPIVAYPAIVTLGPKLANYDNLQSWLILVFTFIIVKSPILVSLFIITPAIIATPFPIIIFFPICADGWIAVAKSMFGMIPNTLFITFCLAQLSPIAMKLTEESESDLRITSGIILQELSWPATAILLKESMFLPGQTTER